MNFEGDYLNCFNRSMCSSPPILQNIGAVDYIVDNDIPGAIVECGVWRGGSIGAMLYRLLEHNDTSRPAYLFDTFTGMTEPTSFDIRGDGKSAIDRFASGPWCIGPIDDVKDFIYTIPYPRENINFVVGDVCNTLPFDTGPIAILRLDTDFYESTKCELEHLFPLVSPGGVILIDDYCTWAGSAKAVDEYLPDSSVLEHPYRCASIMYKDASYNRKL